MKTFEELKNEIHQTKETIDDLSYSLKLILKEITVYSEIKVGDKVNAYSEDWRTKVETKIGMGIVKSFSYDPSTERFSYKLAKVKKDGTAHASAEIWSFGITRLEKVN